MKKRSEFHCSRAMAASASHGTLRFHKMLRSENQTVSSGFTAMTLWPKPLCCLGCKLHVRAESWALTPRGSPNTDPLVFSARQIALCICFTKPKKGRQMSAKPEQSGPLLLGFGSSGRVELKQETVLKMRPRSLPRSFFFFFFLLLKNTRLCINDRRSFDFPQAINYLREGKKRRFVIFQSPAAHIKIDVSEVLNSCLLANLSSGPNAIC